MSDMEYKKYKLKELLTIKNGKDHKKLAEGDYPVYGSGGYMRSVNSFLYGRKSILLPRKGTLSNIQYVSGHPFWTVDTIYYTVLNEKLYDPYYLYLYLNSLDLSGYDSGASIPSMTSKTYYSLNIELPEKKIQTKVANIIRAYENLIENNNKRIKLLEKMAENQYKEWFVRFRFPGYKNVEFEEKKPRGWQVGKDDKKHFAPTIFKYDELRNIGSFIRGKNITTAKMIEGDIPVISAGLQPSGYHNEANVYGASLTISASGANAGYLQYHMKDIWAADCSYYQDDATIWFVYNTLKYLQPVISNLQCGAAQPHVYPKNINRLCILIPPEELIHKYNDYVMPYYDEIKILNKHNQLLTKQRKMLLPRLMSGKLEM